MTSHYSYEEMHLCALDAPFSGITVSFPVKSNMPVLIFCIWFLQISFWKYQVSIFSLQAHYFGRSDDSTAFSTSTMLVLSFWIWFLENWFSES
jgi:hypothetical protein